MKNHIKKLILITLVMSLMTTIPVSAATSVNTKDNMVVKTISIGCGTSLKAGSSGYTRKDTIAIGHYSWGATSSTQYRYNYEYTISSAKLGDVTNYSYISIPNISFTSGNDIFKAADGSITIAAYDSNGTELKSSTLSMPCTNGELLLDMRNISKPDVYLKITVSLGHYWWADSGTYLVQMDLTGNDNLTIYQPSNPRISGTNLAK